MAMRKQLLQYATTVRQRKRREFLALQLEHIEDEQDRGLGCDGLPDELPSERQTLLQCAEISLPTLVGDDDLAVDQRVERQRLSCGDEFGKPRAQVTSASTE